jgi:3-dehydroquinate dehydratase/shikimate dehydrogenase
MSSTAEGPVVCAVIGRTRHKMMQAEIQEAAKQGAKLIELRLDFLAKAPDFKRLLENRPCPMIATFRRPEDGGRWNGSEEQRLMLMRQAVVAGFDYLDIEVDIADQIPRFGKVKRIVSYHNLREVPDKLELIYEQMCEEDADIVKISVTAQHTSDNLRVLKLLKKPIKPTVAFCMGDLGTCSRLLGLRMGMPFTYGAFNRERQMAPGILPFQDLQTIYQVEKISPETKIFGVVGDPVSHSLSPLIHNAAMRKLGINALYLPFRVPRGELAPFLKTFADIPVQGYSVTIPHKEAAARHAAQQDATVAMMGAANTLQATDVGYYATNTDAQAAIESLRANLPFGPDNKQPPLASRMVMILGAGGVARAIAHGLNREGVGLTIANRTEERGKKLAEEVGCKYVDWSARHNVVVDTLINCTSVGMHPNLDESPIHHSFLKPGLMVFDTIYTPETTMLVREARSRGCHVLTGVDMFVRQAGLQFKIFTGQDPPLELMTKLVRRALSPIQSRDDEAPK